MQTVALHGEAACFGLTGDGNGRVGDPTTPLTEGAIHVAKQGGNDEFYLDDTTWAYGTRKDAKGNGGRYCFGGNEAGFWNELGYRPQTADGTQKEGWTRIALHCIAATGWIAEVSGWWTDSNNDAHWRLSLSNTGNRIEVGSTIVDSVGNDVPGNGNEWTIFEVAWRVDSVDGYIRVYKDFNYDTPYLEFEGAVYYDQISGPVAPQHVSQIRFYRGLNDCALDDCKTQNATFRDVAADGYIASDLTYDGNNIAGQTCTFYERSSATAATGTIIVRTSPLPPGVNVITIDGLGLAGSNGSRTPGNDDFHANAGSINAIAQSIADAINDTTNQWYDANGNYGYTAVAVGDTVTVTLDAVGPVGTGAPIVTSYTPATQLDVTAFAGGVEGSLRGTATVWNQKRYDPGYVERIVELYKIISGAGPDEWDALPSNTQFSSDCYARIFDPVSGNTNYWALINQAIDKDSGYCGDGYYHEAQVPDGVSAFGDNMTRAGTDTGANWSQVNAGVAAAGETSYNVATSSADIDVYAYSNFGVPDVDLDRIVGLNVYSRVRKDSSSADVFQVVGQSGATLFAPPSFDALSAGYTVQLSNIPENPADFGDWTQGTINALELGGNFFS